MADAIPVNSAATDEVEGDKQFAKRGTKKVEVVEAPVAESNFKAPGGSPLETHKAVREDF